jgi:hypothetical protein
MLAGMFILSNFTGNFFVIVFSYDNRKNRESQKRDPIQDCKVISLEEKKLIDVPF